MSAQEIWSLCNTLRDDGVSYGDYLNELTFILFLKLSEVKNFEDKIPEQYRWSYFVNESDNLEAFTQYKKFLAEVSTLSNSELIQDIYTNASTNLKNPVNFKSIVSSIDQLDWYEEDDRDVIGDIYESLLQKNANEVKSGAGQYFTPRPLINVMVQLMAPQLGERWNDPACGTFGFMLAADQYLRKKHDEYYELDDNERNFQLQQAFSGVELVSNTHRLAMMNAILHGMESNIILGDTLTELGKSQKGFDGVLANPPFGTKKGGERPTRDDLTFLTSNKQLNFLQHIYRSLKPGGRAAVVLPDNVLFEDGDGQKIRKDLMEKCNLHTILRLPTGIFYAAGVKTNVLFFTKGVKEEAQTQNVWFYDMRTNMPKFGKRTPFTEKAFEDFILAYTGGLTASEVNTYAGEIEEAKRETITDERWQKISRETIAAKNDSLDLGLIADESLTKAEDLGEPLDIAREALTELQAIQLELENLIKELS